MTDTAKTSPDAIDLRSDTVTQPTAGMWDAMRSAPLGDDGLNGDPTVRKLELRIAALLHQDDALFVPSGVMANQLALRLHTSPGDEVIAHARSHVVNNELGAPAALAGVTLRLLDSDDGCLYADDVHDNLRDPDDAGVAPTSLICFENSHNACGGRIVPQDSLMPVSAFARRRGIKLHLDGARLWNAAVASRKSVGELTTAFDTVAVCMSKGLGAPVGSLLAGSDKAILRARRLRRMMGGTMRQAGMLAAAGLYALDHHIDRLAEDHQRAALLADGLAEIAGITVNSPQTNIVTLTVPLGHPARIARTSGGLGLRALLRQRGLLTTGTDDHVRLVTHLDVGDAQIDRAVEIIQTVFAGLS